MAGHVVDDAVTDLVLAALTPLALETSLAVADELAAQAADAESSRQATIIRADYDTELARRRYLAVDPDNRLVAEQLEADWNAALRAAADAREQADKSRAACGGELSATDQSRIRALAADIPALRTDPATPQRERKRLTRLLVNDVTLVQDGRIITVSVRMSGGTTHQLSAYERKCSASYG